ncbi:hypothetical protein ADUPG1_008165 [Aduncisulcus paluster]|uniref:Uncharacterized protein n=1 Tax=Aduncisulcus paluster TaxID=2918883 RepID=A0ABQ5KTZ4_9EUKA|nr:hypothetical protein ADUPG1_008165 [Aduncisulcus paluster]
MKKVSSAPKSLGLKPIPSVNSGSQWNTLGSIPSLRKKVESLLLSKLPDTIENKKFIHEELWSIAVPCQDSTVYQTIREKLWGKEVKPTSKEILANQKQMEARAIKMSEEFFSVLPSSCSPSVSYDVGCGNMIVTKYLSERIYSSSKDPSTSIIYGFDIDTPHSVPVHCEFIKCPAESLVQGAKDLPRPQMITCFNTVHHMASPLKALYSCCDLLQDDGYIILREHNCTNPEYGLLLDIQHGLNFCCFSRIQMMEIDEFIKTFKSIYINQWIIGDILESKGLKLIGMYDLDGKLSPASGKLEKMEEYQLSTLGTPFYFIYKK